jgi:hypothetical protein
MNNPLAILRITIKKKETHVSYIDEGTKMFEYSSIIGAEYVEGKNFNEEVANTWLSYILWCMHSISYIDRIPTNIILICEDNAMWYSSVLERYSYAQFFTNKKKISVIIESNIKNYERHKETISKFTI